MITKPAWMIRTLHDEELQKIDGEAFTGIDIKAMSKVQPAHMSDKQIENLSWDCLQQLSSVQISCFPKSKITVLKKNQYFDSLSNIQKKCVEATKEGDLLSFLIPYRESQIESRNRLL